MSDHPVYHAGEIAVQIRTGDRSLAERRQGLIAGSVAEGAQHFLERQNVVAVGAADRADQVWASLWCGAPGFLQRGTLGGHVQLGLALEQFEGDPVRPLLRTGQPLALLVINFVTRERFRINGLVTRLDGENLQLRVHEAFGNCRKYIQERHPVARAAGSPSREVLHGLTLDEARQAFVAGADTAFVASRHSSRGLDVSHRGGHPGFIRVTSDRSMRIPDYPGNGLYQTLGNFEIDSRAGLSLIDFDRGRVLALTGSAAAEFGQDDPAQPTGGTGRYWTFTLTRWVEFPLASTMSWTLIERSSFNPAPSTDR